MLLEPVMNAEIIAPNENLGDVIGDLNSRRGRVSKIDVNDNQSQQILASVPLSSLIGYTTALRSMTQGRATSSLTFYAYDLVPSNIADEVLKKYRGF